MKKISWLEKFAESRKAESEMEKTASKNKNVNSLREELIISREDINNAKTGSLVSYNGKKYKVVNAEYEDAEGPGALLQETTPDDAGLTPTQETLNMAMGTTVTDTLSGEQAAQEYARTNPGDVYNYDVQTTEQTKWENEAAETQNEVNMENAVDRTTPKGKYETTPSKLNNGVDTTPIVEEPVTEEPTEEVEFESETPVEDVIEVDDIPTEEPVVEEPVEEVEFDEEDPVEDVVEDVVEVDDIPAEEETEVEFDEEDPVDETAVEENSDDTDEDKEDDEDKKDDEDKEDDKEDDEDDEDKKKFNFESSRSNRILRRIISCRK